MMWGWIVVQEEGIQAVQRDAVDYEEAVRRVREEVVDIRTIAQRIRTIDE